MTTQNRLITYTIAALLCWGCQEDNQPPQNFPVISNVTITEITDSTALCTITVNTSEAIFYAGVEYGTDPSQLTVSSSTNDISGSTIALLIKNLADDRVYYYKVYVRDKIGGMFIYSEIGEFKTQTSSYGSTFSNGITPARSFKDGDGTQNNPYLIANAQQLKKLVEDVNNGNYYYTNTYFKLTTDIEVTADEWIPIGNNHNNSAIFSCNFDGNGHTISGTLKSDKYTEFGFFGYLHNEANISNLTIAATVKNEGNFASSSSDGYTSTHTGGIAGSAWSSSVLISHCHITGTVAGGIANESYTGGVLGYGRATIQYCDVSQTITGGNAVDRLITTDDGWTNIEDGVSYTAGINGRNFGEITDCIIFASAKVIGGECRSPVTGGITAWNDFYYYSGNNFIPAKINNCTNHATVTGGSNTEVWSFTGGIVGINIGDIMNCTVSTSGMVIGNGSGTDAGGIAGRNSWWWTGEIYYSGKITNCTNNSAVSGKNNVGGLVGNNSGEIHTCLNTGNVFVNTGNIGGLAGINSHNELTHIYSCCTNRGTVNGLAANANNQIGSGQPIEPCPDGHTKR